MNIPRKQTFAQRTTALLSVFGKTIQQIDIESPQLNIRFTDGTLLTLASTDPCQRTHMIVANELPTDTPLEDLRFRYTRGIIERRKATRTHIIGLELYTPDHVAMIEFINTHHVTCQKLALRYKVTFTGCLKEGEF